MKQWYALYVFLYSSFKMLYNFHSVKLSDKEWFGLSFAPKILKKYGKQFA